MGLTAVASLDDGGARAHCRTALQRQVDRDRNGSRERGRKYTAKEDHVGVRQ